jgi:hypothetical protein
VRALSAAEQKTRGGQAGGRASWRAGAPARWRRTCAAGPRAAGASGAGTGRPGAGEEGQPRRARELRATISSTSSPLARSSALFLYLTILAAGCDSHSTGSGIKSSNRLHLYCRPRSSPRPRAFPAAPCGAAAAAAARLLLAAAAAARRGARHTLLLRGVSPSCVLAALGEARACSCCRMRRWSNGRLPRRRVHWRDDGRDRRLPGGGARDEKGATVRRCTALL